MINNDRNGKTRKRKKKKKDTVCFSKELFKRLCLSFLARDFPQTGRNFNPFVLSLTFPKWPMENADLQSL